MLALQYWWCQNPVCEVYMQKSLFADGFHNTWKEMTEQRALQWSSDSASQDPIPQLPDSPFRGLNSVPSLVPPQKNLHVPWHKRNYGNLSMSSSSIQTPLAIHEDSPCASSQIYAVKSTPAAARMFAVEDTSCPLNLNASDGKLRHINRPNPSLKPRARELNLAIVSQFTPREKLLYVKIRKKQSAPCKLRT